LNPLTFKVFVNGLKTSWKLVTFPRTNWNFADALLFRHKPAKNLTGNRQEKRQAENYGRMSFTNNYGLYFMANHLINKGGTKKKEIL